MSDCRSGSLSIFFQSIGFAQAFFAGIGNRNLLPVTLLLCPEMLSEKWREALLTKVRLWLPMAAGQQQMQPILPSRERVYARTIRCFESYA
jgi:hypothetical protein